MLPGVQRVRPTGLWPKRKLAEKRGFHAGIADGGHAAAVRSAVNAACAVLSSDSGWAALRLAESFGIPDHCLQAPIAFDWRQIGSQHLG